MAPRSQQSCSYKVCAAHSAGVSEVATKRGFSLPSMCSAFATTRRAPSQPLFFVFLVRYSNSVKTRAGLPVRLHCCVASCICCPTIFLFAMQGQVGGVHVQHDLARSARMR